MIEIFVDYGLFLAKTATITVSILVALSGVASLFSRGKVRAKSGVQVESLNIKHKNTAEKLELAISPKHLRKRLLKEKKAARKAEKKKEQKKPTLKKRLFVLDFKGDIRASATENLREEITAVLSAIRPSDEVLVRLESLGGMVHSYGLAASQLLRLKNKARLTVSVDKAAASGGYLMAATADKIIAAPFAVIGSIGVVAQLPNFNRLLKKHDIDFEQITAGKHKRTLTMFGENTEEDREKFKQEIDEVHQLFKNFLGQTRKDLDMEKVSTGEHWHGTQALELKLVDEVTTSDDYILSQQEEADIFEISYKEKRSLRDKIPFLSKLRNINGNFV